MLSQVVINQGNFALQNRAENVVQTVVHCFSITSTNKLKINKITPLSQSPLGSHQAIDLPMAFFAFIRIIHTFADADRHRGASVTGQSGWGCNGHIEKRLP